MGLPIVFIHGYPLDGTMWAAQASALAGAGNVVLTPDLPGFGAAPPLPQENCTIDDYAAVIHQLILRQAGGSAIVGGFSMGGYILMALLRHHPQVVRAAMFIDTRPEPDSPEARAGRLQAIQKVQEGGVSAICDSLLEKVLSKHAGPALRRQVRAMMLRQSPAGVVAALRAMSCRNDATDLLPTLKIPMLLLVGDHDTLTPPSVAFNMYNHKPHAMLAQIADAGHMAPLEQPAAVSKAMQTFLVTVSSNTP